MAKAIPSPVRDRATEIRFKSWDAAEKNLKVLPDGSHEVEIEGVKIKVNEPTANWASFVHAIQNKAIEAILGAPRPITGA